MVFFYLLQIIIYWVALLVLTAVGLFVVVSIQTQWVRRRKRGDYTEDYCSQFFKKRYHGKRILKIATSMTLVVLLLILGLGLLSGRWVRNKIAESSRLVVRTGGNCHRQPDREIVLFQTHDAVELQQLAEQISVGLSMPGTACMCCGSMTFDLYDADGLYFSFVYHHGEHIRVKDSSYGDLQLTSSSNQNLHKWLAEKGVDKKLAEYREQLKSQTCPKCGYNLTGNVSGVCPECGEQI